MFDPLLNHPSKLIERNYYVSPNHLMFVSNCLYPSTLPFLLSYFSNSTFASRCLFTSKSIPPSFPTILDPPFSFLNFPRIPSMDSSTSIFRIFPFLYKKNNQYVATDT